MKKFMAVSSLVGALLLTTATIANAETPAIPSVQKLTEFVFPDGVHTYSMVDVISAMGKGASFDQDKKEFVAQFNKATIRIPVMPATTVYINDQETTLSVPVFADKKGDHATIYAPKELFGKAGISISNTNLVEIGKSPQPTAEQQSPQAQPIQQGPIQQAPQQMNLTSNGNQIAGTAENPVIIINGVPLQTDTPPVLKDNRVLVPLRTIFEGLKGTVNWNNEARRVDGSLADKTVSLVIDDTNATVNGVSTSLDVPAQIMDSHTMVPLRFISQALGAQVNWDGSNDVVSITK
jgi:hypothetical protein